MLDLEAALRASLTLGLLNGRTCGWSDLPFALASMSSSSEIRLALLLL